MQIIRNEHFPLKHETEAIIYLGIEVHKSLGLGFSEIVYKDALEGEFIINEIPFEREKEYKVNYKGLLLKHKFFADFVIFDKVILEIKAKNGIAYDDIKQSENYLKCSSKEVALIMNFGRNKIELKRVVL